MEILEALLKAESFERISLIVLLTAFVVLLGFVLKVLFGIYKADKEMLTSLYAKSIIHDQEHISINNDIKNLLNELRANRDNDRQLLSIVAKKAKIEIPKL